MKENSDQFEFEGIFTHFACADTKDDSYYKKQLEKFNELKDALDDLPPYVHVANSAASMWHDDCGGNAVRSCGGGAADAHSACLGKLLA